MAPGLIVLAYLIGALPTGLILVRLLRGEDIRRHGSRNIGAANVLRVAGPAVAAAVLLVDVLKGLVPVLLALRAGLAPWAVVAAGLAAIAGHNWSPFLGFRGGKGIATSFGVLVGLSLPSALVAAGIWLAAVGVTRFSSLGSLLAAVSVPTTLWRLHTPPEYVVFGIVASLFAIYRHRANIQRLVAGTELRITDRVAHKS